MAANLVRAGFAVRGFDLSPAARAAAEASGVPIAAGAAEAVADADAVVTMLPAGAHVRSAYATVLPAARRGALFVDCSTIDVSDARAAQAAAEAAGMQALDAPVSGGVGGATAGTLTFMCGGTREAFERAGPILAAMGKRIVLCGGSGAGQAAKMCNNLILGITMAATCEAFVLAETLDLDPQALFDVASTASGQSWSLTSYCPVPGPVPSTPANRDYQPGFATALMLKDMNLALGAAERGGVALPVGRRAAELYRQFAEAGGAGRDFSGVIHQIRGARHEPS